jgi:hypothetical protein
LDAIPVDAIKVTTDTNMINASLYFDVLDMIWPGKMVLPVINVF